MQEKILSSPRLIFLIFATVLTVWRLIPYDIGPYLSAAFGQVVVVAILPILIIRISGKELGFTIKAASLRSIVVALVSTLAFVVIRYYLLAATEHIVSIPPEIWAETKKLAEASTIKDFFAKAAIIALLPSLCEEIFSRGICQTALSAHYGNRSGLIIAAGLFAALHITDPWLIHLHFLSGCFFGWIYMTGGTLWLPVICHFTVNLWAVANSNYEWVKLPTGIPAVDMVIVACAVVVFLIMIRQSNLLRRTDSKSAQCVVADLCFMGKKNKGENL